LSNAFFLVSLPIQSPKTHYVKSFLCILFLFVSIKILAQDSTAIQAEKDSTTIQAAKQSLHQISLTGYGISGKMPFWMRANQYATAPIGSGLAVNTSSRAEKRLGKKGFIIGYGTDIVINLSSKNQLILPELYGNLKYKKWELYVGRRKEVFGFADTTLGTGSFSWAGNALPMPKIHLGLTDYVPLKFTKNLVSIKGHYAHGWFGTSVHAFGYMLHQKTFFVKVSKPSWPIALYGGFVHNVQWGGRTFEDLGTVTNRHLPSRFSDYLYVVTGWGGMTGSFNRSGNAFDSTNRVGNHVGTLDVGLEWRLEKKLLTFYRQSVIEDGSLYYLNSIADGLHGLIIRNLFPKRSKGRISIEKVTLEFLYTMSQGGPIFGPTNFTRGNDNYFNHQQYFDGWSYRRQIIGTPFIVQKEDTKLNYNYNSLEIATSNRVRVYHAGFQGYIGEKMQFMGKLSLSHHYGNYNFPYPVPAKQLSGLFQLSGDINALGGFRWHTALAFDQGSLYQNSMGVKVGIQKSF
jgi:hypothetical protein